jgi:aldehyde:ferredoxin oxidoreductase
VIWDKPARGIYEGLPSEEKAAALAWSKKMFGSEDAIVATEYTGKPALLIYEMNGAAIADSLGYCTTMVRPSRVGAPGTQIGDMSYEFAADRYAAATGVPTDEAALFEAGERICNIERALAVMDGRSRETDTLHEHFFKVPIPDGPQKGRVLDKAKFEAMKDEYYTLRGWEVATGFQKGSTLKKLGMNDVAGELKKAKRLGRENEG